MENFVYLVLFIPPLLLALTIHEYSHGYVAYRLGDPTAKLEGRLTLNPLKHIDIFGFLSFLIFRIGWAKPVPINPYNFSNIKKGIILTSLAGPLSNFILAIPFGLILRFIPKDVSILNPIIIMAYGGLVYNLVLCAFNLIPIPPLDGSKILFPLLPSSTIKMQMWLERYGFVVLIALIFFDRLTGVPVLWGWIGPFVSIFGQLFGGHLPLI
ncbi:hypothetical protein A2Y85_05680 [candidate division WOR-3 bacterium RBG_13_43_14]|uniref:Peptidase M50 domain-containing protein n=1 Tax=candidate division WOR-3 bacterium RBG_13_43_14 TaxID=1802590 RepID=A0A1F4UEB6_UNCW3|nr:MAG: hypothetical protein A2Y85_05680 [candidate division WOR-3 bacterium RBG_13_43_14]